MASELYNVIDALSREKGIDPQIVVSAVEDAIVVATRKYYKTQENLRAELDKESGQIRAYAVRSIVESSDQIEDPLSQITLDDAKRVDPAAEVGGELRTYKATDVLGRIAAQLAKQVIFQKVREAERDTIYNEYIGRVGEIINATIKRQEGQDVIVDLGKAEGAHAAQRTVAAGVVRSRRAGACSDLARRESFEGTAGCRISRRAGTGVASVPDRSTRDLRQHGGHSRHRPRSR